MTISKWPGYPTIYDTMKSTREFGLMISAKRTESSLT